tara:strand:+ start:286 stop:429 length:144 start_codon:yes stop_codon:yes gene_type:complete
MNIKFNPKPYVKELKAKARNEKIKEALCFLFICGVFTFILLFFSKQL